MSGALAAVEYGLENEDAMIANTVQQAVQDVARAVAGELQGVRSLPLARVRRIRTAEAVYHVTGSLVDAGPGAASTVVVVVERREPEPPPEDELRRTFGLTKKEAMVTRLLAQGRSNADIAKALMISPHTARHHTESVLIKLSTNTRDRVPAIVHEAFADA